MKRFNLMLMCLVSINVFSQEATEKEVKTNVGEVTVFIQGAQITRKKLIDVMPGESVLKFVNLSPFIDAKSVQVRADGDVSVLSVNHQQNYLDKMEKPKELTDLETKLKQVNDNLKLEQAYLEITKEELAFLYENRAIGGKNQDLNVANLKEASAFYGSSLKALKLKEIGLNNTIEDLARQKNNIEIQMQILTSIKEYATGEILVKVTARNNERVNFEISYLVSNASWFPSYDIRANSLIDPVELIYKANVRQDTKEDWKDVKLRFSSSDPNKTGVAPELKTYFLNYNTLPPVYNQTNNVISGKVFDSNQQPLPGANVLVEGSTIGTVTDINGNYSLTVPPNAANLSFSFVGYLPEKMPITGSVMNVRLEEDIIALEEVVVIGYGTEGESDYSRALQGKVAGVSVINRGDKKARETSGITGQSVRVEKQTTVDFEIKTPYTIMSDNKNYTVNMEVCELPASYQYYCVPKVDKDAFLIAHIIDWEKFSLLEGEANLFFENTFVGKSLLDVRYAADTLHISLGRDKNVSVNREKVKEFTSKQFVGSRKEETRDWMITVKNNKSQKVNMVIMDQLPVSTLEEIEVNVQKISGANHNVETGEIKWEFTLDPNEQKNFDLKYAVKYPKFRNLLIE